MWMGDFSSINLVGLLIQSIFVQNILLFYFLGMCSYLACSNKMATANGLGLAVTFVVTIAGSLNFFVHRYITGEGALSWLSYLGINAQGINLNFLELIIYISVIAAFVQIVEIIIDKYSPALYHALGVYLPLITVNCAILGACLFATTRQYPFIPNLFYLVGSGVGWWVAICLIASIREKLGYSNVIPELKGMGITFMVTGLMALGFMALAGIDLDQTKKPEQTLSFSPIKK
jgi:Na+-transporting NADH:ubiquinone oxidoreductase subunit E